MSKIGKIFLNKLSAFIIANFNCDRIELDKYLVSIENEIIKMFGSDIDRQDYSDYLCDYISEEYRRLFDILRYQIQLKGASSRVHVIEDCHTYYIENTKLGINVNTNKIDRVNLSAILNNAKLLDNKEKGYFFEEFCFYFLNDMGFTNLYKTASSGDLGVDIVARVPFSIKGPLFQYLLSPEAHVLVQCKYLFGKADTPIVRKIIGDSYYYRLHTIQFDEKKYKIAHSPLYLLLISHNGFTKEAVRFAGDNCINLLDSDKLIDLVCQCDISKSQCIKYLKDVNDKWKRIAREE